MGMGVVMCIFYWDLLNVHFSRMVYDSTLKYEGNKQKS